MGPEAVEEVKKPHGIAVVIKLEDKKVIHLIESVCKRIMKYFRVPVNRQKTHYINNIGVNREVDNVEP